MTLKAIESRFAEILQEQMKSESVIDLTLEGPVISKLPPKVIWAKLQYGENLQQSPEVLQRPGFFCEAFKDFDSASRKYPEIQMKFKGQPWAIAQFLNSSETRALIDFEELGSVLLSKSQLESKPGSQLHDLLLPLWLNYALSPELWGPQGKWTRFHERLMNLFDQYNLLDGKASLGYYPLQSKAEKLANLGFKGTCLEKSFLLVTPWSFSLTELNKLEAIIRQEF